MVYKAQTTLCKGSNFSLLKFGGELVEQAPVFFSFSLIFFSFLTSQTPSEDDNSEDEWLNPSILEVKGTGQRNLRQIKVYHVFNEVIH